MRGILHPLSGALYDLQSDGTVRVEKDGKTGVFRRDGSYVSGEIYFADPHLCLWIAGRELPSRHRQGADASKPNRR
jgi:hypothetical protein